eukprot:127980-Chlamydomonas_euryale.AAC.1
MAALMACDSELHGLPSPDTGNVCGPLPPTPLPHPRSSTCPHRNTGMATLVLRDSELRGLSSPDTGNVSPFTGSAAVLVYNTLPAAASVAVINTTFSRCTSREYAPLHLGVFDALSAGFASVRVSGCAFEGNADGSAGAPAGLFSAGALAVQECTVDGGGGGGPRPRVVVEDSVFSGNAGASVGGAVRAGRGCSVELSRSEFTGNSAAGGGGAVAVGVDSGGDTQVWRGFGS